MQRGCLCARVCSSRPHRFPGCTAGDLIFLSLLSAPASCQPPASPFTPPCPQLSVQPVRVQPSQPLQPQPGGRRVWAQICSVASGGEKQSPFLLPSQTRGPQAQRRVFLTEPFKLGDGAAWDPLHGSGFQGHSWVLRNFKSRPKWQSGWPACLHPWV